VEGVQRGAFQLRLVFANKHHRALAVFGNFRKPVEAPSVAVPESIIPSADASGPKPLRRLFPDAVKVTRVRLPESFRGGCSFGAGA
jgi:hypothetical protein